MFELLGPPLRHRARARATGAATYRGRRRGSRAGRAWLALGGVAALVPVLRAGSAAAASGASLENLWRSRRREMRWPSGLRTSAPIRSCRPRPGPRGAPGRRRSTCRLPAPGPRRWRSVRRATRLRCGCASTGLTGSCRRRRGPRAAPGSRQSICPAPDRNAAYPRVAVGSGGVAYAVWVSNYATDNEVVQAAARSAGGTWQPPVDLSTAGRIYDSPRVANDSAGDAVAVWGWHDRSDTGNEVVQAATRPARGGWRAPVTLSPAGHYADFPSVAMNPAGVAYAVWRDPAGSGFVQAAARPAGGVWQPPVTLSTADWNSWEPQVALNAAGDAVAVWEATPAGELTEDHAVVQAAARSAHAETRFWQAPVNLSAPGPTGSPEVALDPAGDAVAVWEDYDPSSSNDVVRAATRTAASGAWQAPIMLSAADQNNSFSPQIALDSAGDALAVWQCGDGLTSPAPRGRRRAQPPAASGRPRSTYQPPAVSRPRTCPTSSAGLSASPARRSPPPGWSPASPAPLRPRSPTSQPRRRRPTHASLAAAPSPCTSSQDRTGSNPAHTQLRRRPRHTHWQDTINRDRAAFVTPATRLTTPSGRWSRGCSPVPRPRLATG